LEALASDAGAASLSTKPPPPLRCAPFLEKKGVGQAAEQVQQVLGEGGNQVRAVPREGQPQPAALGVGERVQPLPGELPGAVPGVRGIRPHLKEEEKGVSVTVVVLNS